MLLTPGIANRFQSKMKRSKKDSAEQLNRNEWMRGSGSFSSKGYLSRGLLISWGPEKRGLQGSQGEWPVPGDFSDSQLLELAWLGRGQDSNPVRPQGSGEENEAHEDGGILYYCCFNILRGW
jgi:hypothetical protein